jgi:hypothetical protein
VLEGKITEDGGMVYLDCPDCDYIQTWVPDVVLEHYLSSLSLGASRLATPAGTYGGGVVIN